MPKVLIVEDDEVIAEGMCRHLGAAGFDPVSVGNGTQGLARLRYEKPDVMVLDLMLPGEDGLAICRRLRAGGVTLPVIMLTAKGDDVDRIVGLEMGADDYLPKPFNPRELVARINAVLRRQGPAPVPGAPAASRSP